MSTLAQIGAAGYAVLLFAAAFGKVDSWSAWQDTLDVVSPLPRRATSGVLYGLPILEGSVGTLLIASPRLGYLAAASLLSSFSIGALLLSVEHKGQSCNCFGALMPSEISPSLAGRNAILAALAACGAYVAQRTDTGRVSLATLMIVLLVTVSLFLGAQFHRFTHLNAKTLSHE